MKSPHRVFLALVLPFVLLRLAAADPQVTFKVVATFDYPNQSASTLASGVNDRGLVAAYFATTRLARGFVRFPNGNFSQPIREPNEVADITWLTGINNLSTVCGVYQAHGSLQSFFLSDDTFVEFAIPGRDTYVQGINDAGNFTGYSTTDADITSFVSIDGTVTFFTVGGFVPFPHGINNLNQCVGYYQDEEGNGHGFWRQADGTLNYPIDVGLGATNTGLDGVNDRGWMAGGHAGHAAFFLTPNKAFLYDYPGALVTSFAGINNRGLICGYYQDTSAVIHGLLVRVIVTEE